MDPVCGGKHPGGRATHLCLLFSSRSAAVATLCRVSLEATTRCTTVSTSGTCSASMNFTMPSLHCREHADVHRESMQFCPRVKGGGVGWGRCIPAPAAQHSTGPLRSPSWQRRRSCLGEAGGDPGQGLPPPLHLPGGRGGWVGWVIRSAQTCR